uniref:Acyl-CoA ligase AKT1 n=1 Tax=Alternaria alternata TaxID=5599 RepID=AKT1_ALTAL|nr:RecName: Full=Acyl-CoA ligase AKT1; AltName: Full=AK-toxin biosynthesis protein 1 [Alternaria alternata]BAA36588.1 Akt1 [Alternaria alternata]
MVFAAPCWVPPLPSDLPDSTTLEEFIFCQVKDSQTRSELDRSILICGTQGKEYTVQESMERTGRLAQGLSAWLDWPQKPSEEDWKVAAIFNINCVEFFSISHAIHRLGGTVSAINASSTADELEAQLRLSNAQAIFTCNTLLKIAMKASQKVGIPLANIFLTDAPGSYRPDDVYPFQEIDNIVRTARSSLPLLQLGRGQGSSTPAYICFSSGTSGAQKPVLLSHQGIIANIVQINTFEKFRQKGPNVSLCILPLAHSYGLVCVAYNALYRGDRLAVLPSSDVEDLLSIVEKLRINTLYLVPTLLSRILSGGKAGGHDLSCVKEVYTGGAPLHPMLGEHILRHHPTWKTKQCYGATEAGTAVSVTSDCDLWPGSVGCLLPGVQAKIIRSDGSETTKHDESGELWVSSPSLAIGYLSNPLATEATFTVDNTGRTWLRTGDEAKICLSPNGNEHLFIVDRIKDIIKVKGFQVAPVELEQLLLSNDFVEEVAITSRQDKRGEERPQAFVVRTHEGLKEPQDAVSESLQALVKARKARYKWLHPHVIFVDSLPKTTSGKIMRRALRNMCPANSEVNGRLSSKI